jgi:hypothetical protein
MTFFGGVGPTRTAKNIDINITKDAGPGGGGGQ